MSKITNQKIAIPQNDYFPLVSVLISVRNEEKNIRSLINSLANQLYPIDKMELLIIDDSSEDNTFLILKSKLNLLPFSYQLFQAKEFNLFGKKECITFLSTKAKGEILMFTDGDCIVPSDWISTTVNVFNLDNTFLVCGGVEFNNRGTFFEKISTLEFAALIQTSMGAISHKLPFMCNAANMAIKRETYLKIKESISRILSSGDDVFLLKTVAENFGSSTIKINQKCVVSTNSPTSIRQFVQQRIRWAGKSSKSYWINSFMISLIVFVISVVIFAFGIASFFNINFLIPFVSIFILKWLVDCFVLNQYQKQYKLFKWWILYSMLLEFVYPFYVLFIALLSLKSTYL